MNSYIAAGSISRFWARIPSPSYRVAGNDVVLAAGKGQGCRLECHNVLDQVVTLLVRVDVKQGEGNIFDALLESEEINRKSNRRCS